jgi:hypothetical protein
VVEAEAGSQDRLEDACDPGVVDEVQPGRSPVEDVAEPVGVLVRTDVGRDAPVELRVQLLELPRVEGARHRDPALEVEEVALAVVEHGPLDGDPDGLR